MHLEGFFKKDFQEIVTQEKLFINSALCCKHKQEKEQGLDCSHELCFITYM